MLSALQWVIQRKTLEREKGHANEVVLADEQGRLLEGTQTNFYAVIDGELWTAGNDLVLPGTIREIVLRVCERNSIPVRFEPPPVDSHKLGVLLRRKRQRETDRQRDRQRDREKERERERQTDRQADRQAGRETDRETERKRDRPMETHGETETAYGDTNDILRKT